MSSSGPPPATKPFTVPTLSNLPTTHRDFRESGGRRNFPAALSLAYSSSSPSSQYAHGIPFVQLPRTSIRLKAKEFGKHVIEQFAELYRSTDSSDVSIVCGSNHDMMRAHQIVLSCGSLYFRDALKIAPSKHPTVVVRDITGPDMGKILEYIYLGQVTIKSESELSRFLKDAKYLQVIGIQEGKYFLSR